MGTVISSSILSDIHLHMHTHTHGYMYFSISALKFCFSSMIFYWNMYTYCLLILCVSNLTSVSSVFTPFLCAAISSSSFNFSFEYIDSKYTTTVLLLLLLLLLLILLRVLPVFQSLLQVRSVEISGVRYLADWKPFPSASQQCQRTDCSDTE